MENGLKIATEHTRKCQTTRSGQRRDAPRQGIEGSAICVGGRGRGRVCTSVSDVFAIPAARR